MIEVRDTGIGIASEDLDRVFDAFVQVGTRMEGLGLGLAITKAIVEMHEGTIRASSEGAGKGATFMVELLTTNGR